MISRLSAAAISHEYIGYMAIDGVNISHHYKNGSHEPHAILMIIIAARHNSHA